MSPGRFLPARRTPPRGRRSNSRRGTIAEHTWEGRGAVAVLRREGYNAAPAFGGKGPADVNAVKADPRTPGPSLRRVQVKRRATFTPSAMNDAVRHWLGLGNHKPPTLLAGDETHEVWLLRRPPGLGRTGACHR